MKTGERNCRQFFAIRSSEAKLHRKIVVVIVVVNVMVTRYSTAMVTVLEGTPLIVSTTGTAPPEVTLAGTSTLTW